MSKKRSDQIFESFLKFHEENRSVWELFQRFAFDAIKSGRRQYSSDAVCHRIRWHTAIETRGEDVKINDHYTAYYARMFHAKYPEHNSFFETRVRKSEQRDAYDVDIQVFNFGTAANEEELTRRLREVS